MRQGLRVTVVLFLIVFVMGGATGCNDEKLVCPDLDIEYETVPLQLVSTGVTGIDGSTSYTFVLRGLLPPVEYEIGALFISETNANFNNASETVAVNIDGVGFGGHFFADDNANIERTLMVTIPLSYSELFYFAHDRKAEITLTTSAAVGEGTLPFEGSMYCWLAYNGKERVN